MADVDWIGRRRGALCAFAVIAKNPAPFFAMGIPVQH
jgi:hypothetical protein